MKNTLSIDDYIRQRVDEELANRPKVELIPVDQFCKNMGLSRVTIWRQEKLGKIYLTRIGDKIFVNMEQFAIKPKKQ